MISKRLIFSLVLFLHSFWLFGQQSVITFPKNSAEVLESFGENKAILESLWPQMDICKSVNIIGSIIPVGEDRSFAYMRASAVSDLIRAYYPSININVNIATGDISTMILGLILKNHKEYSKNEKIVELFESNSSPSEKIYQLKKILGSYEFAELEQ